MFRFRFAAIRRTDRSNHIQFFTTVADCEHDARIHFADRYVLIMQARVRLNTLAGV